MEKRYCGDTDRMYGEAMAAGQDPLGTEHRFTVNLRSFREQAGMSQAAVAEGMQDAGFAYFRQQTIDRIEKGAQRPRLGECQALAMVLGTRLALMLQPPELADRAWLTLMAVRDTRAARRAADDAAERLASVRGRLEQAIARAEKTSPDELAPEISLGRTALKDTEG
jgi:transcriptional regulator with XRE-family HTH domain